MNKEEDKKKLANQLVNDIRNLKHLGKSISEIKKTMTEKGFYSSYVDEVLDFIDKQDETHSVNYSGSADKEHRNKVVSTSAKHKFHSSHAHSHVVLVLIIVFIVFFLLSALLLFPVNNPPKKETTAVLDYKIELDSNIFTRQAGIKFVTVFEVRETNKPVEVEVTYDIINSKQDIVFQWRERRTITGYQTFEVNRVIETLPEGKYYMFSEADYGISKKKTARTLIFDIMEQLPVVEYEPDEPVEVPIVVGPVEPDEPTIESDEPPIVPDEPTVVPDEPPVEPDEPSEIPSGEVAEQYEEQKDERQKVLDMIELAKTYSESDPAKAVLTCKNLTKSMFVDGCIQQLLEKSLNYAYCEHIKDISLKDYCYTSYVIKTKDFDKCSLIVVGKSRDSCTKLNPSYVQGTGES